MFWWLMTSGVVTQNRVTQYLNFSQEPVSRAPALANGLNRFQPLEFARATDGYIYMVNGLGPMYKWDGLTNQVLKAGVEPPATALVISGTGSGDILGTYQAYQRYLDKDGNPSNLSPVSNTAVFNNVGTVNYTSVDIPTEDNVTRRQILRNTAGQLLTFYVDIDTDDLASTSFSSTRTDADLRNQTSVPLFDDSLAVNLANRYGVPRNDKPLIAYYNKRLWLYGEIFYDEGHLEVTFGSTTVQGVGTDFRSELEDRFLYVNGADRWYQIESVDEAAQTLTLEETYKNVTDLFATYSIRSAPGIRPLLAYSEAGQFNAWPAAQSLEVASSDDIEDVGTGLAATQSFLFILQQRHVYRLSFLEDPAVDGGIFLSARRGCVNNRCWVPVDGFLYMLDDRGIYRFDGSDATEELSQPIQDIFYFDRPEGELRINWKASRYFHAVHDRNDATIRWFVALSGNYLPRHAICFNYAEPQWWLEEYPWPVGDSMLIKQVNPYAVVAGQARKVYVVGVSTLDVADPKAGDTRGSVVSATHFSVTTSGMTFASSGLVGAPIAIVGGRGKGQVRKVYSHSGQTFRITEPWTTIPDTTSTFQVGGIPWEWKSGWSRWLFQEINQARRISTSWLPHSEDNTMDLRIYEDYAQDPTAFALTWPRTSIESSGVQTTEDETDAVIDLTQSKGFAYLTLDAWKAYDEYRGDNIAVELRGHSGVDPTRIYEINIEGAAE